MKTNNSNNTPNTPKPTIDTLIANLRQIMSEKAGILREKQSLNPTLTVKTHIVGFFLRKVEK